jgi:hypothetical protein
MIIQNEEGMHSLGSRWKAHRSAKTVISRRAMYGCFASLAAMYPVPVKPATCRKGRRQRLPPATMFAIVTLYSA